MVEKDGIGGQIGELRFVDDVADLVAGDVGLEVGLDRRDGLGFFGLVVGDELGELLLQQLILGFEARDEAEDLFQNLAQRQAAIHGGGFAQLVESVVLVGLVEDLAVHVVDDAVPLPASTAAAMVSFSRTVSSNFSKNMRSIFMPS